METFRLPSTGPAQRAVADAIAHLAGWLDHHMGARPSAPVRPARLTYVEGRRRSSHPDRGSRPCPACGDPLLATEDGVELRGDVYHAACALYRTKGKR